MVHKGTRLIETERLILRRFSNADADDAFRGWFSDTDSAMYMRWNPHTDISLTRDVISHIVSDYEKPEYYRWAITLKGEDKAIGAIGLHVESEYDSVASVSYVLSKTFRNRGITSDALEAVLCYAFTSIGFNRVEGFHADSNPASGKVMINAGMKYEGHLRQKYRSKKGYEDCSLYAAVAEDRHITSLSEDVALRAASENEAGEPRR